MPDQLYYDSASVMILNAIPESGYSFFGWSGGVTGSENPASIQILHDTTVTAIFNLIEQFTILSSADAHGTIIPQGTVTVNRGADTTFTITPETGYHCVDIHVDTGSVGAHQTYSFHNITANHAINAAFAINTLTITPSAGAYGSINPSAPVSVNYGADTTFTFSPNAGYHTDSLYIDGAGQLAPSKATKNIKIKISNGVTRTYTFYTVTANHDIRATFRKKQ